MFTEKIAFVFPGQGAQYVGMAQDLYDAYPIVRYTFEQVSDMVHKDVARACLNGPVDVLNQPGNDVAGDICAFGFNCACHRTTF